MPKIVVLQLLNELDVLSLAIIESFNFNYTIYLQKHFASKWKKQRNLFVK